MISGYLDVHCTFVSCTEVHLWIISWIPFYKLFQPSQPLPPHFIHPLAGDSKIIAAIAEAQFKGFSLPSIVTEQLQKVTGYELMLALLDPNPASRPPLDTSPHSDIAKSSFFKGFNWTALLGGTMFPPFVPPPMRSTGKPVPYVMPQR